MATNKGERKTWTSDEDKLLRELYPEGKSKEIATRLNRTISSVRARALTLHVSRRRIDTPPPPRNYIEKVNSYTIRHYARAY